MAETDQDVSATRSHLDRAFDSIAEAMKQAARKEDYRLASSEAERCGLEKTAAARPPGIAWQKTNHSLTLWFQWRYYDQSHPFSIQKDMNILSLELWDGNKILRQVEERYED